MLKFLVSSILCLGLGLITAHAAEPAKGADPGKPAKAATASSAAPAAATATPAAGASGAKINEPSKASDNSGADRAGKGEVKVVCHDKVKDGKPVMGKDGKPVQECKKIRVRQKLESHDIPPAKK